VNSLEYFLKDIDISVFAKSSQVKAKTFLEILDVNHSPSLGNTYLVIGKNIVGYGLQQLGYDVTIANGLSGDLTLADAVATGKTWDYVIAPDEYFVYAANEQQQIEEINRLCNLARLGLYTTLKDYRNMHASQRFFEEPFEVKQDSGNSIVIKKRDWDREDKQKWIKREYIIANEDLIVCDSAECRTVYFKQLAKFSTDAGAKKFQVEKKQMYKALFSKTYEYIVYISF